MLAVALEHRVAAESQPEPLDAGLEGERRPSSEVANGRTALDLRPQGAEGVHPVRKTHGARACQPPKPRSRGRTCNRARRTWRLAPPPSTCVLPGPPLGCAEIMPGIPQPQGAPSEMPIAADYPFLDILWTMIIFFTWVVWIWIMIVILTDVFLRRDISGWGKAAWVIFLIILPFLGALVYLIAQHEWMGQRGAQQAKAQQAQTDEYVRSVAGGAAADRRPRSRRPSSCSTAAPSASRSTRPSRPRPWPPPRAPSAPRRAIVTGRRWRSLSRGRAVTSMGMRTSLRRALKGCTIGTCASSPAPTSNGHFTRTGPERVGGLAAVRAVHRGCRGGGDAPGSRHLGARAACR